MHPADEPLWHGYTLTDIDRYARISARTARGNRILDPTDCYQIAWSAITETLATADDAPTGIDLIAAGSTAVSRASYDHRHTWGINRAWGSDQGSMARFNRYWELASRPAGSMEDAIVDRAALRQIWPRLSLTHRQVLHALAIHDNDPRAAAESLGRTITTFQSHLVSARAAYRALWHEHETPSRMWGRSGRRGRRTATQVLRSRRRARTSAAVPPSA